MKQGSRLFLSIPQLWWQYFKWPLVATQAIGLLSCKNIEHSFNRKHIGVPLKPSMIVRHAQLCIHPSLFGFDKVDCLDEAIERNTTTGLPSTEQQRSNLNNLLVRKFEWLWRMWEYVKCLWDYVRCSILNLAIYTVWVVPLFIFKGILNDLIVCSDNRLWGSFSCLCQRNNHFLSTHTFLPWWYLFIPICSFMV
jgi:hypothetical protein